MGKLIELSADQWEPFLNGLRDLLNSAYGDMGGEAKIVDGKIIFEQSWEPSESIQSHYSRVVIAIEEIKIRN